MDICILVIGYTFIICRPNDRVSIYKYDIYYYTKKMREINRKRKIREMSITFIKIGYSII